jgi:aminoglycoside phosphotransferase (APT) family kinase protein
MLTVDARLELFKKQFPQEKIKSVQERQGADHEILEINHTWMCKSAKTEEGVAALDREVKILKALQGKILTQIPEPVYYEENFLVYKKIPGSPLISYAFFRYGNKQRSKLICELVEFLLQLHKAFDQEQAHNLGLMQTDWPWSVEKLQENRHYLQDYPEMFEVFDNIIKMHQKAQDQAFQPVLIHNDFAMNNIIVDPLTGQLRGVIDFADVAFDDPALDLRIRHNNPVEFSKAISFVYGLMNESQENPQKIYSYYFMTEFSRYFQYRQQDKIEDSLKTLQRIADSLKSFLKSHDSCVDEACQHQHNVMQEKVDQAVL